MTEQTVQVVQKKTILWIDDEISTHYVKPYVEELLEVVTKLDWNIQQFESVDEGWQFYQEHKDELVGVILDISMPPGKLATTEDPFGLRVGVHLYHLMRASSPDLKITFFSYVSEEGRMAKRFARDPNCLFTLRQDHLPFMLPPPVTLFFLGDDLEKAGVVDVSILHLIGNLFNRDNKPDLAYQTFTKVISLESQNGLYYYDFADAAIRLNLFDEAFEYLERAYEFSPDDLKTEICRYAGKTLFRQSHFVEAIKWYKRGLAISENNSNLWLGLGQIHFLSQIYDQAVVCYCKAVEVDPGCEKSWSGLGDSLFAMGQVKKAVKAYKSVGKLNQYDWSNHYKLGLCYIQLNKPRCMEKTFETALEMMSDPSREAVLCCLSIANIFKLRGKTVKSQAALDKAVKMQPKLPKGKVPDNVLAKKREAIPRPHSTQVQPSV